MNNNERESIIDLLKEKDVLLNMRKHFNYHFIDGKIYVAIILAATGFLTGFFNSFLFENFANNHIALSLLVSAVFLVCVVALFISICILCEEDFKIVFNKDRYIKSRLTAKEIVHLKAIVPDNKKNKLDSYKSFINIKRQKIDNEFKKKEKLEGLYNVLRKDSDLFNEYKSYFEDKLKDYNKLQKRKKENNANLNKELKEAGMDLLEDDSQSLSLKISEE